MAAMVDWLLANGSYLGIILGLALTGCGLPIPEEVFIIATGVLAAQGRLDPTLAIMACLIGALLGDCIMYYIGRRFGRRVLDEHPWWTGFLTPQREKQIEQMFQRHGLKVFFVARFLIGLRSPVYLTAGILRVSFKRFILVDTLCAAAVIGSFFALSYFYGEAIGSWISRAEMGVTIVVLLAFGIGAMIAWKYRHQLRQLAALPAPEDAPPEPSDTSETDDSPRASEAPTETNDTPSDRLPPGRSATRA